MTLKFTFFYSDLNKDYFLGLLQKIAQNFGLEVCVEFSDKTLDFYASGENLGDFANALETEIPLSLYFRFKNVEVCEKSAHLKPLQNAQSTENILSVSEINARKFLQDSALKDKLQNFCDSLKNGHKITLSTSKGKIALFTKKSDSHDDSQDSDSQKHDSHDSQQNFDFILANDISTISLYTRASQDEINALASFEKPLINLPIKEVFISAVGAKNALFILPFDMILCYISNILLDFEIPFLYAKKIAFDSSVDLAHKGANSDRFFEIVVGQRGYFLEKNVLDSAKSKNLSQFLDLNFADFAPQRHESKGDLAHDSHDSQNNDILITYISTANPTLIAPFSTKIPFVKIAFDKNPKNILAKITQLENGDKLIANFAREFESRYQKIQSLDSAPQMSENIVDIFECAEMILEANQNADSHIDSCESNSVISPKQGILNLAQCCIRDIGPKIDFKNIKRENALFYDEIRTIRSIISFTLAGSEREIVAFGLLESLVDYLVLIFSQNKNYIKSVGIIGDLFANKIFFDKITKKIPADFRLILPKILDYSEGQIARHTN